MDPSARILVTGGSGMVGTALLRRLKRECYDNVVAPSSKHFDLRDSSAAQRMFVVHPTDYVFHLAGHIGGIGASVTYPVEFLYENVMIGMNVIHAARLANVKKMLVLSSSCVYPRECLQPMKEEYILTGAFEPTNEGYAIAKVAAMKLCEFANRQYGTNFLNLMPCNLYGYGDHFEPERSHAVSALMYKMHKAKEKELPSIEVWGTGIARRELLFIDDMVDAMVHFMRHVDAKDIGAFVNVGLGEDVSIRELAGMLRDIVGYPGEILFNPKMPDGMPRKLMDVSRAAQLGWIAKVGIAEGLRRTYEWYRNNAAA